MNLQEILEQNDLVMSINNNFNVLSFYKTLKYFNF